MVKPDRIVIGIRDSKLSQIQTQEFINLAENNIGSLIHYPIAPHKQRALKSFNKLKLPITESLQDKVISIPLHPKLLDSEVNYIIEKLNDFR